MDFLLPATVYQPPRSTRGRHLNTIVEDHEDTMHGFTSESEGTASDTTIIAKPIARYPTQQHQSRRRAYTTGPPSVESSECDDDEAPEPSSRSSCADSDNGTIFSDSCPSLTGSHASEATSFATNSTRTSIANRNSRNRYPSLLIPRGSWTLEGEVKQLAFGMSPSTKLRLSPEALEMLPKHIPSIDAPPSLADTASIRSVSPCPHAMLSAPATPNLHNLELVEGQSWGGEAQSAILDTHLEIAIDEEHSILLSPDEAHSEGPYSAISHVASTWNEDIYRQFPAIPGATPIEMTPVTPNIPRGEGFDFPAVSESGVQLPAQALEVLQGLNRQKYNESTSTSPVQNKDKEMEQCTLPSQPRASGNQSPVSEYSMSGLSIPSPGGFFSSLQGGAGNTWAASSRKASPPPPSSSTAENFYNTPWNRPAAVKETILEYDTGTETDGPPTVKQSTFNLCEDSDMYGSSVRPTRNHEYEETYEQTLIQTAGLNIDRTSDWLSAQTSYLAALREVEPEDEVAAAPAKTEEVASIAETPIKDDTAKEQQASSTDKEPVFLQAFTYQASEAQPSDAFFHASSRLNSVQNTRIALPKRHVQSLLNIHTSKTLESGHARPKYRGPFSQNPARTEDSSNLDDEADFHMLERQQLALNAIKPNLWALEAQQTILYNGRLMASQAASDRLTTKDAECAITDPMKPPKKRPRVLDLAGAATASWAWAAASKWSNSQVYTVQTDEQAELAKKHAATEEDVESFRPDTPRNHELKTTPRLWQLPFSDDYFDVISARTLHMYLRANPVPGADSIDEWDMTLKECMRVLKPNGVLDFFVMDSGISNASESTRSMAAVNLSPIKTAQAFEPSHRIDITTEFKTDLLRRGYETDGGCGRLMSRLRQEGFVGVKRQWIGLPMGRVETASSSHRRMASNVSATHQEINQARSGFRSTPRPISEVSAVSRLIDQYADMEAVQGPVGTTTDVSDMSALLGELLWEEWLVRLRLESGRYTPETVLDGVPEQFNEWRRTGKAAWRGVLGWARKPSKKAIRAAELASVTSSIPSEIRSRNFTHGFAIPTPASTPGLKPPMSYSAPAGIRRQASIRHASRVSAMSAGSGLSINTTVSNTRRASRISEVTMEEFTHSAIDRGELGLIPMMIID